MPTFNDVPLDISRLPPELARAARTIARRLAERGHRAWIVGGAARDLWRGETPKDLDLVSAALPEEVEALFPRTIPVGRSFGIVVVVVDGVQVEVATFREERGYSDGRRPDEVLFGKSLEHDAARRDFTCNALYVDPLTGEVADPEGGRADLAAGRLRCVGDPRARFAEDGLRLLRLARFAARLACEPDEPTLAAARASLDALRGVSAERVLAELEGVFRGPAVRRAFEIMLAVGALGRALPLWARHDRVPHAERLDALGALPERPQLVRGLGLLLASDPSGAEAPVEADLAQLEALRPSRRVRDDVAAVWTLAPRLASLHTVAERTLALRAGPWREAMDVARAWRRAHAAPHGDLDALEAWRAERSEDALFPPPLLASGDLAAAGIPRGPRWGRLLAAAEVAQLDGAFADRAGALAWLAREGRASDA